jgi:excisionase family DNA binding protein
MFPLLPAQGARLMFVTDVAGALRVSQRTVRWWASTGRLRAGRLGTKIWAFKDADVEAFRRLRFRMGAK